MATFWVESEGYVVSHLVLSWKVMKILALHLASYDTMPTEKLKGGSWLLVVVEVHAPLIVFTDISLGVGGLLPFVRDEGILFSSLSDFTLVEKQR